MRITCSILCHNYGRFLTQAIDSCINQFPGDYEVEVLVVDDGSTDETPEVCAGYGDRIRVIRSENCGFGPTLDKAIRGATGDYVCLLDADDYFAPEKLLTLLPAMESGYLYIQHNKYLIDEAGAMIGPEVEAGGNTSTLCLQRSAAMTLLPSLNEIFFHPLKSAGHGLEMSEPLSFYRIHPSSMMRHGLKHNWHLHHAEVTRALAKNLLSLNDCPWADRKMLQKISHEFRAVSCYDQVEAALVLKHRVLAIALSCKMLAFAALSKQGIRGWHVRVASRSLLGRSMYRNSNTTRKSC